MANFIKVKWPFLAVIKENKLINLHRFRKENRSTEGCSNLKSPETRQVQEILISTLKHMQVPKWDGISCPEE